MTEHRFDQPRCSLSGGRGAERCFDYGLMLDELRCHASESLHELRSEAIAEQRWWHLRELAVTAVLDERGQIDDTTAAEDGTTTRTARRTLATARKLKSQPNVARAAAQGKLSQEQLDKVTDLADGDPQAEARWAAQGPGWSPDDLADALRKQRTRRSRTLPPGARHGSCATGGTATRGCSTGGSRSPMSTVRRSSRSSTP